MVSIKTLCHIALSFNGLIEELLCSRLKFLPIEKWFGEDTNQGQKNNHDADFLKYINIRPCLT